MVSQKIFSFATPGRGMLDLVPELKDYIAQSSITTGLCQLFLHHTSASLILCENADSDVQRDLEDFMQRLAPDGDPCFRHRQEGPDDMPAHIRTVLTQNSLSIPITQKELVLGTWQGIYLWEHRLGVFQRKLTVTLIGA